MLLIRLLAIFLVLIINTWLLHPVRSDAVGRYKRAMARRADTELSRLAGEPCTVSGVWRFRRQPRSLSPSQHRPPVAHSRASRRQLNTAKSASAVCSGRCTFDTEVHRVAPAGEDGGGWGEAEDVAVGAGDAHDLLAGFIYEQRFPKDRGTTDHGNEDSTQQPGASSLKDSGQGQSPLGSLSRFPRSLDGTSPPKTESSTRSGKVSPSSGKVPPSNSTD